MIEFGNALIEFFRDTLSGVNYYIYVAIIILFIFALIGYIGEKKKNESRNNDEKLNTQLNSGV